MAAPATPFVNDGSFMAQFMAQQQQQGAGALGLQAHPQITLATTQQPQQPGLPPGWVPATAPQDMLMQGGTSPTQFDVHNSSPQLVFSDNGAVVKRTLGMDPTASKFCFAALVPVADRHGRFAVRLERGVPVASADGTFRTQEGMFLGVYYLSISIYLSLSTAVDLSIDRSLYLSIYGYIYMYVYVCMLVCIRMFVYIYIYIQTYVYIPTYIHTHTCIYTHR